MPSGFNNQAQVDYEVSAPRSVLTRAKTVNGKLEVAGLEGGHAANSVNGTVSLSGLLCEVRARAVNGAMTASFEMLPDSVAPRFSAVTGRIQVDLS